MEQNSMTQKTSIKATIIVDRSLWKAFVGYARLKHESTASQLLREYIKKVVAENSGVKQ